MGGYVRRSFSSCFAIRDNVTNETTWNSPHADMKTCLSFILLGSVHLTSSARQPSRAGSGSWLAYI
jgi:hypothetical protein